MRNRNESNTADLTPPTDSTQENAPEQVAAVNTETVSDVAKAITNRFDGRDGKPGLFTAILFENSNAKSYTNDKDKSVSRKVALVFCEVKGTGLYLKGSITARRSPGQKGSSADFSWFGNQQFQSCIKLEDAQATADMDAYKRIITQTFSDHLRTNPIALASAKESASAITLDLDI